MKFSAMLAAVAATVVLPAAVPAHADLQIVQTTVIDCPGMKQMLKEVPDASRAPLLKMLSPMLTGTPWVTTTFLKDNHLRTDMGQTTVLVNSVTGNQVTMDDRTRTYSIGAYDPFQAAAGYISVRITATSVRAKMLGYTVERYALDMTSSVLPKSRIAGEIWAAPGLPTPPAMDYTSGMAAGFESQMSKVHGMPLAYRIVYTNTPAGDIAVTSYATKISDSALPMSDFRIPDDFRRGAVQTATMTPSAGFPLGDGVPLDSSSPVTSDMIGADGGAAAGVNLQSLIGGLSGAGAGGSAGSTGALASSISPQMLQQLEQELQTLTSGDSGQ